MPGVPSGQVKILAAIQSALEGAGIKFVGSPADAPGVCLRFKSKKMSNNSNKPDERSLTDIPSAPSIGELLGVTPILPGESEASYRA